MNKSLKEIHYYHMISAKEAFSLMYFNFVSNDGIKVCSQDFVETLNFWPPKQVSDLCSSLCSYLSSCCETRRHICVIRNQSTCCSISIFFFIE